jgi:serine phosphatase RsbU (regulator of sigma subunit)
MLPLSPIPEATIEVIEADGSRVTAKVDATPFLIGRGGEEGNHLQLGDKRVSRCSVALVLADGVFSVVDRGQRQGVFVNGEKLEGPRVLREGDVVTLGSAEGLELVFHLGDRETLPELLSRMEGLSTLEPGARDLRQLSLLLEATALLQSGLPIEELLGAMVDRAITITDADRGLLLEADATGRLSPLVARQCGALSLSSSSVSPSQTVISRAVELGHSLIEQDLSQAASALRAAASIVLQGLRTVIAIPLFSLGPGVSSASSSLATERSLLGVLYLDSRRPAAFSNLQRQILDALALEAASVLDNARLVRRERERQRLEQELAIARQIQQALLPRAFEGYANLRVCGLNRSCLAVGGDYFDLTKLSGERTAFVIADVCGKGLGAALLTAMLQGAFASLTIGQEIAPLCGHLNRYICSHAGVQRYATLFFGVIDPSGRMEFVNAGHLPPLRLRGGRAEFSFRAECLPVGLLPLAQYSTCTEQLQPGDTLILMTDGITEALNPEEEQFGNERLVEVVEGNAGAGVEELEAAILSNVEGFTRGAYQSDDLTLLVIRYEGRG